MALTGLKMKKLFQAGVRGLGPFPGGPFQAHEGVDYLSSNVDVTDHFKIYLKALQSALSAGDVKEPTHRPAPPSRQSWRPWSRESWPLMSLARTCPHAASPTWRCGEEPRNAGAGTSFL